MEVLKECSGRGGTRGLELGRGDIGVRDIVYKREKTMNK